MWEYIPGMSRRTVREVESYREHDWVSEKGTELTGFGLGNFVFLILVLAYGRMRAKTPPKSPVPAGCAPDWREGGEARGLG